MNNRLKNIFNTAPFKIILFLLIGWIIMLAINYYITENITYTGSRITFPISIVYFSPFYLEGILCAILFLIFGFFVLRKCESFSTPILIICYIILILLGNFSQGSIHNIFLRSFIDTDFQYYHDAIKIDNGYDFISHFNENQENLLMHSKTHPPFAVWLHYILLKISNHSVLGLSLFMSSIGLFAIVPLIKIFSLLNVSKSYRNLLLIIFALIPAVNIYSVVSIDAVLLTFSLIFLYGLLLINQAQKITIKGILITLIGFTLSNSISFGGTFLAALAFIFCVYNIIYKKDYHTFINFSIVGILFLFILVVLYVSLNYNHIEAFFNASKSENPRGFRGFDQPFIYFFTRIECISEILLFLSFAFFAYLFRSKVFNLKTSNINFIIPMIAFISLGLMFIMGAYGTGETARACLFIYPYFILLLINIKDKQILYNIAYIALIQTFGMQLIGEYFY